MWELWLVFCRLAMVNIHFSQLIFLMDVVTYKF
jgi:hypothetical protein